MRPARFSLLVDKAVDAAAAAIEVYNKPSFSYREEAFSILMINAWELLLKARILRENDNQMRSIEVWETVKKRDGSPGARQLPRKNRSGNNFTINLQGACAKVRSYESQGIDDLCISNLELLTEIRDNAVHLNNKSRNLRKRVQEVGTGALRNFVRAASGWFGRDLSDLNFAIMPLAFESTYGVLESVFNEPQRGAAGRLLSLISSKQAEYPFHEARPFNVGVEIEMRFARRTTPEAIAVQLGTPAEGAIPVFMREEDVFQRYPWTYADLLARMSQRYSDFRQNKRFHDARKALEGDARFCRARRLNPANPRSQKQNFYNPNILREFDPHYTRASQE